MDLFTDLYSIAIRGSRKALFFFIATVKREEDAKTVSISPTGKGVSGFLTPFQGRTAIAVFAKIILTTLRYFSKKPCTD